ncbi:MAG TPA: ATP synthase F1 subunit gamma [Ignavibacteria bacterium]|nr:ATP synthase F1 subunit gamma [Ignavibacteria bacterium]
MATLRDIKSSIKGIQNIQQITKAMKMVATAKLKRAQENVINSRPYARKISSMLSHLVTDEYRSTNMMFYQKENNKTLLVVVTSDRGLCGAFNTNIIREANRIIDEDFAANKIEYEFYCVGKKGYDFFENRAYPINGYKTGVFSSLQYESALEIADHIISGYHSQKYDSVIMVYNEFKSIIQQKIVSEQFLPIPKLADNSNSDNAISGYIIEPNQKYIFDYLIPKHLKAQIWRILSESNAAEFGARMTAMDNATTNAKEMIRTLQLKYNKERQASITKEILEIVSGAEALKS